MGRVSGLFRLLSVRVYVLLLFRKSLSGLYDAQAPVLGPLGRGLALEGLAARAALPLASEANKGTLTLRVTPS